MDEEIEIWKWVAIGVGIVIFIASVLIGFSRWASPFSEETRRLTHTESAAYQQGMAQNLDRLCLEWERTGNPAIAQSIRHRVAGYTGELPDHVQACVNLARQEI